MGISLRKPGNPEKSIPFLVDIEEESLQEAIALHKRAGLRRMADLSFLAGSVLGFGAKSHSQISSIEKRHTTAPLHTQEARR